MSFAEGASDDAVHDVKGSAPKRIRKWFHPFATTSGAPFATWCRQLFGRQRIDWIAIEA